MSKDHLVVIGNGPAGNQAALSLRENDEDARITLISREPKGSYRPHLLPDLVAGKIEEEELYVTSAGTYAERNIRLRSGQQVVGIDLANRQVFLEHKEVLSCDGMIIAVGGKPRIPERLLAFLNIMLTLKTPNDAKTWMHRLTEGESVLMIGGDLTSLAFTKALLHLGKKVYFMVNEEAFWPFRYEEALYEALAERLKKAGVQVLTFNRLRGMAGEREGSIEVYLDDRQITVGVVGAFFGLLPDIRFLAKSGLSIDRGILVDEYLSTGFENVYAAGDCAQVYHPEIKDYWVSIGHGNAVALGRAAAMNLLGGKVEAGVSEESIYDIQGIKVNTSWWMEF